MRFALLIAGALAALGCAPAEADAGQNPPDPAVTQAKDNEWIGKEAKPFRLANDQGGETDLAKILGEQPFVLVFYRGHWWPFCHRQFGELAQLQKEIQETGTVIIGTSNEGADKLQAMRKDEGLNDKVLMLSDPNGEAAKLYAGAAPRGFLNAATFVIGKDKKIKMAFFEEDYKLRPKAKDILELLKAQ